MNIIGIKTDKHDACFCVTVKGEIDTYSSSQLRDTMVKANHTGLGLIIDITEVSYIDSSGIAALLEASKQCLNTDRCMIIVCSDENRIIPKILRMVGLEIFFNIVPTVDAAIEQLNESPVKATQN